jgi:KDO2-lipid IV(A) lauroyltransferase
VRVDGGELFPLFGVDATTTTAPAWLSLKTGCAVVPIQTRRLDGDRFRVTVFPPLPAPPDELPPEEAIRRTTVEMNQALASLISDNPGQWLCTKRRWPRDAMKARGAY